MNPSTDSKQHQHLMACHECDILIDMDMDMDMEIGPKQIVQCPRCHHSVFSGHKNPLDHVIATGIAASIILIIANSFPFLTFEAQGQSRSISLIDSIYVLVQQGFPTLAAMIFCFIILLPMIYLLSLLALTLPVKLGMQRSPPILLGRCIALLLPWSMAEVFLIGVLVALIKIVAMADIIMGTSFWAYVIFTVMFIYISNIANAHRVWQWVEYSATAGDEHGQ